MDPAIVTNARPGDLFVVRNVANLVPPYENDHTSYHGVSSALEFAVCFLEVKHIIVFGHSNCGGLSWLFNDLNHQETSFIDKWMELASPAVQKVKDEGAELAFDKKLELCCRYSLLNSINNLKTFPWISTKLIKKEISLHAWYFDISTGSIMFVDQESKFSHL